MQAISSGSSTEDEQHLMHMFVGKLTEAGFDVTGKNKNGVFVHDVECCAFGMGYGVTVIAILSASSAVLHTYPERKYGERAEVEFNLCYLHGRKNHDLSLERAVKVFADWFKCKGLVKISHSMRRYLVPLPIPKKRKKTNKKTNPLLGNGKKKK